MRLRILIFIIVQLFCFRLYTQEYDAPDLSCVKRIGNNTVIDWRVPSVTCGNFLKYYIHFSSNSTGPFQIIDSVITQSSTSYTHLGVLPRPSIGYYYLSSKFNCIGWSSRTSKILSDEDLPLVQLNSISIENNKPVYLWNSTNRPEVYGYIIAQLGGRIIAYVNGRDSSSYTDTSFDATKGYYQGGVASRDSCDNSNYRLNRSGTFEQRTSFLSLNNNPCNNSIDLSWTKYLGWDALDGVKEYQILVTKNSEPEKIEGINDPSTLAYIYSNFIYGDTLNIRIKVIHPTNPTIYSHTNSYSFIARKTQKPDLFQCISASYENNFHVRLTWYCDPTTKPRGFHFQQIQTNNNQIIREKKNISFYTNGNGFYYAFDEMGNSKFPTYYKIIMQDSCNGEYESQIAYTPFLTATQIGLYRNDLSWPNTLFSDQALYTLVSRDLFLSFDGQNYSPLSSGLSNDAVFQHDFSGWKNGNGNLCYQTITKFKFDTVGVLRDSVFETKSQSNCIDVRTVLWMPTAFKISGYTSTFKPLLIFHTSNTFSMKIFNRWGEQIFETNDPITGWNGVMKNGITAPEDAYMYRVEYIGNDGKSITKTGTFAVFK